MVVVVEAAARHLLPLHDRTLEGVTLRRDEESQTVDQLAPRRVRRHHHGERRRREAGGGDAHPRLRRRHTSRRPGASADARRLRHERRRRPRDHSRRAAAWPDGCGRRPQRRRRRRHEPAARRPRRRHVRRGRRRTTADDGLCAELRPRGDIADRERRRRPRDGLAPPNLHRHPHPGRIGLVELLLRPRRILPVDESDEAAVVAQPSLLLRPRPHHLDRLDRPKALEDAEEALLVQRGREVPDVQVGRVGVGRRVVPRVPSHLLLVSVRDPAPSRARRACRARPAPA